MNLIPAFVRRRIEHRPNLVKIVENITWLFLDNVLRMGVGLLVGVWVARYLGPSQFGLLNFATAFVGLFGSIASLGLQSIVVRDILFDPTSKEDTLGTAAVLHLVGGIVAYSLILGSIFWLRPADNLAIWIVAILGSTMMFKVSDIAVYWFESQVISKYAVWVQSSIFLAFALVKVILILNHASLVAFACTTMAEALVVSVLLCIMLGQLGPRIPSLRFKLSRARTLLKDSWPLLISGVAIMIYMKIDQIMLGEMVGDVEVGIYSAAVRISEIWYFAIGIVLASVFPNLAKNYEMKSAALEHQWVIAYRAIFWFSVGVAIFITSFSHLLVELLFGDDYFGAGTVLSIHVWAGINVAVGSVWSKWLILENRLKIGLYGHLIGATLNIILNFLLIPKYGAVGAALGTLISYWLSALITYSLHKPKETFGLISEAIFYRRIKWN